MNWQYVLRKRAFVLLHSFNIWTARENSLASIQARAATKMSSS